MGEEITRGRGQEAGRAIPHEAMLKGKNVVGVKGELGPSSVRNYNLIGEKGRGRGVKRWGRRWWGRGRKGVGGTEIHVWIEWEASMRGKRVGGENMATHATNPQAGKAEVMGGTRGVKELGTVVTRADMVSGLLGRGEAKSAHVVGGCAV